MNYEIIGEEGSTPKIAILTNRIKVDLINKHYIEPYLSGLPDGVMVCDLYNDPTKKKTSATDIKEYLNTFMPDLIDAGITTVIVTNPDYFKVITKQAKTDTTIGAMLPTVVDSITATYCPNYERVFHDPIKMKEKIHLALTSFTHWLGDTSFANGKDVIQFAAYPETDAEIQAWLDRLMEENRPLTVDIEAYSLKHDKAGIGTITFCWNKHEGIAFQVDKAPGLKNVNVRWMLKGFFSQFKNKLIYHGITYDVYVLIYQLYMDHILDQKGLLEGLDIMLKNWDCSQILTYLATNSCAGNELGLKPNSQAFLGNYAVDEIKDITKIALPELLEYNLKDGLATWYVYDKHYAIAEADDQIDVYETIFKPAVKDIIQMQLTGLPINMEKVKQLDIELKAEEADLLAKLSSLTVIGDFVTRLEDEYVTKKNLSYKKKVITSSDIPEGEIEFNPNSSNQLQKLLYGEDFLAFPVLDRTKSNQPSTGADTLEKLKFHTKNPDVLAFLDVLIEYKALAIILSTFLPAFLSAVEGVDGWHYLFGNFRLGGTVSGRLSSNNPNLQNIPSMGSTPAKRRLAKMLKKCVQAPKGWLFVGLDFDSLEDKISAVTTRDPNKVKVYSDGYDGHCLRAHSYFGDQMPDIELAPENSTTYRATLNNKIIYFHSEEIIDYMGVRCTGEELFNKLK